MRFFKSLLVAFVATASVAAQLPPPTPQPGPAPTPTTPKVDFKVLERPALAAMDKKDAVVGELIRVAGSTATAQWEIVPATASCDIHPDGHGNATISAVDPGIYYAICYDGQSAKWLQLTFTSKVIPGPGPTPPGPTPPGPIPPGPTPPPTPSTKPVKRFVIVENTANAGQFRGLIMGSSTVQTYYKANGLSHRLIPSTSVDGDEDTQGFITKAVGKTLPYMWTFDADKKQVWEGQCPTSTPEAFVAALSTSEQAHVRKMGNKPPPQNGKLKFAWKVYGTTPQTPMIPRSQWKPMTLEAYLPAVKDQDGIGACNAFSTVNLVMGCRAQAGLAYRDLSTGYLYGNINGGSDDGSLLEDALAWMVSHGTCLSSTVPDLVWQKNKWSNAAKAAEEAKNFTVLEAYLCPTFDHLASAVQEGFFLGQGIRWYDNYNTDADGWLPAKGRGNWGGHAVCGFGLAQRKGVWGIATRNSWSTSWGDNGNMVIPESLYDNTIGGWWAVRAVRQVDGPTAETIDPFARKFATMGTTKQRSAAYSDHFLAP